MESQPQNPEFRNNLENFHPCDKHHNLFFLSLLISFSSQNNENNDEFVTW